MKVVISETEEREAMELLDQIMEEARQKKKPIPMVLVDDEDLVDTQKSPDLFV